MTNSDATQAPRQRRILHDAERKGVRLWCRAKLIAYGTIGLWMTVESAWPEVVWFLADILILSLMAVALLAVTRRPWYRAWVSYVFAGGEALFCVAVLMMPNPLIDFDLAMTAWLRFTPMAYLFVFLASTALTLAPRLVLWAGSLAAAGWIGAVLLVLATDDAAFTMVFMDHSGMQDASEHAFIYDPAFVDLGRHLDETLVILVVTGLLAAAVGRARQLMIARLESERARANLSRYFAPALVDELAADSHSVTEIAEREAAVLFIDIIGFTRRCEGLGAIETMHFLRAFHRRMDAAVFAHDGTLDKYIGDAVMATFGTPRTGPRDAANALACSVAVQDIVDDWSRQLVAGGAPPLQVGIGVHYGPVVTGDIGGEQRLEFAVIGDTVNVAARLETLTRVRDADIAISQALAEAARAQGGGALLAGFVPGKPVALRGRSATIVPWQRPRGDRAVEAAAE
ncbi:MAG: adenylate/guanylate cyclase domain-containing protein [Alphaproteobacteria bacterium]